MSYDFNEELNNGAIDYEKESYGKVAYRQVQRLRKKARERGFEVPRLNYMLTKPEKPRILFWIIAAVSTALFIGIIVLTGFLYNELIKTFSDLSGMGEFFSVLFSPDALKISLGLSALPGILLILIYLLVFVLFLLPVAGIIYFYLFVRDTFYMAKCSKEEFAKGNIITSRIFTLTVFLIAMTVIFIYLLTSITAPSARTLIGLIYAGLMLTVGGLLALIIVERAKAKKWFATLDDYKKENYTEHVKALRRVKGRLRSERQMWT